MDYIIKENQKIKSDFKTKTHHILTFVDEDALKFFMDQVENWCKKDADLGQLLSRKSAEEMHFTPTFDPDKIKLSNSAYERIYFHDVCLGKARNLIKTEEVEKKIQGHYDQLNEIEVFAGDEGVEKDKVILKKQIADSVKSIILENKALQSLELNEEATLYFANVVEEFVEEIQAELFTGARSFSI